MTYIAPVADTLFILRHVVPLAGISGTSRFADVTEDTATIILNEAGRLAGEVMAPLNAASDTSPANLENGRVRSPPGFDTAYRALAEGGWVGLAADPSHGGAGLPQLINQSVNEYLAGACLSLQLNMMLSQGQIEALEHHAEPWMQALYLPKLITGAWNGTMCMTEAQAGSDVGALTCRAAPAGDGSYRITGRKIFITWGDGDLTENTCHAVLARLPDGPAGVRGISLFLVPHLIPDAGGRPGAVNPVRVTRVEHKLGIHGSPTCELQFDGATGWLIGAPHAGMAAMFTMMNASRLGVGIQGVGVGETALQKAVAYASMRVQSGRAIIDHADIRRMLGTARASLFAARAICLACAAEIDRARATDSAEAQARAAFLTPIAKAWGTDTGCKVADVALQVHGGAGYIEETGAAQYLRDVRVTSIYEGTNGIQAMDLVGRKLADDGVAAFALIDDMQSGARMAQAVLPDPAHRVWHAAEALREATTEMVARPESDRNAGAMPFLSAFARVLGAHFHLHAAMSGDSARLTLARIYLDRILPHMEGDLAEARTGSADLDALPDSALTGADRLPD